MITPVFDTGDVVKYTTAIRNDEEISKKGIKNGYWLYAKIPPYVEHELLKKGINIHDQNNTKAILKEINENYPYLKTTTKHHRG